MTSHDVVARVRRLAGTRKVGHAGTLDPMATGVLVLGIDRATRLLGHLMLTDKAYDATVRLGVATTTDDAEGEVVATAPADGLTEQAVREALAGFVGEIEQVPSAVSAIKVDGRRAYDRVRAGEQVDLEARTVRVDELTRARGRAATRSTSRCVARAAPTSGPSPGTSGGVLGVGGHLVALRRTAVGPYTLDPGAHAGAARGRPRGAADRRRRAAGVPEPRPRPGSRPPTCGFGRKLDAGPGRRGTGGAVRARRRLPRALRPGGRRARGPSRCSSESGDARAVRPASPRTNVISTQSIAVKSRAADSW